MNGRLLLLRVYMPAIVRQSILRDLLAAMARAFERDRPSTTGLSAVELNELIVDLSSTWAEDAIAGRDLEPLEQRLFAEAAALGRRARGRLRIRSDVEGLEAARLIYRAIGIDLAWSGADGHIVVPRCAFATRYRPATCLLMSSMDSGLIAGLTGAEGLRFTARLTEGAPACRARILHAKGAA